MKDEWRYYVIGTSIEGNLLELVKFRTGDCAELFASALKEAFSEQYPNLELEIEDLHRPRTFQDLMERGLDA